MGQDTLKQTSYKKAVITILMLYHVNILDTPNVLKSYSIPLKGTIGSLLYSISQSEKADNKRTYMAAAACLLFLCC